MFKKMFSNATALALVVSGLSAGPALAQDAQGISPVGRWEADDHDSRYEVTLCGDGTQLCAKLFWINPDKLNERNVRYLDKFVIYQGVHTRPNKWEGQIDIYGTKVDGTVKMLSENLIEVRGCAFFIFCQGFTLERIG